MKLVTTALERTYEAHETDVRAQTLEDAASLLVLRRDTFRVIDGDGPGHDAPAAEPIGGNQASEAQEEQVDQKTEERAGSADGHEAATQSPKAVKCTFSGMVPIDLQQFLDSGVPSVECASLYQHQFPLSTQGSPPISIPQTAQNTVNLNGIAMGKA